MKVLELFEHFGDRPFSIRVDGRIAISNLTEDMFKRLSSSMGDIYAVEYRNNNILLSLPSDLDFQRVINSKYESYVQEGTVITVFGSIC